MDISELKSRLETAIAERDAAQIKILEAQDEIRQTIKELTDLTSDNNSKESDKTKKEFSLNFDFKKHVLRLCYIAVAVLFLYLIWIAGFKIWNSFSGSIIPSKITMTAAQKHLTETAFDLVKSDIADGKIKTVKLAISAISSELPASVREKVLEKIGSITLEDLPAKLDSILKKITITDQTSVRSKTWQLRVQCATA
jgi:hypothetical protein